MHTKKQENTYQPSKEPQWALNIQAHMENTFHPWLKRKPSLGYQLYRSLVFLLCIIITIFWPFNNYLFDAALLAICWILLSQITTKLPWWALLLFNMLNIAFLYYIMKLFIPFYV